MSEQDEHDVEHDEATETVVSPETVVDADTEEAEAEEAETPDTPQSRTSQTEREVEKAAKALQKHATTNANRISAIMGEDAQHLEPCPRCMGGDPSLPKTPGFIWPPSIVPLLPEHKAAVKLSIGEGAEPVYKANDDAYTCPKCAGAGKYPTGSSVPSEKFIRCDQCNGRGWIGQRALDAPRVPQNNVPELVAVGGYGEEEKPRQDPWGRLIGDPLFGVMPGFEPD